MNHKEMHQAVQKQALSLMTDLGLTIIPLCSHDHNGMDSVHLERCKTPGKTPIFKGWSNSVLEERRFPTTQEMKVMFRRTPDINFGLVLGQSQNYNIVGVDIDGEEGLKKWDELVASRQIPITWEFYTGGNGYRLLFALPAGLKTKKKKITLDGKHQEIAFICQGQQTVLPPSIHPSGELYEWVEGRSPWDVALAECPDWIISKIEATSEITDTKSPTVIINPDKKITEGSRSEELTKQLGSLIRKNYAAGKSAVRGLCFGYADEKCDPPLEKAELIKMFDWLWEKETKAQEARKEKDQNKEIFTPTSLGREFIKLQLEKGVEFRYRNDEHCFMYCETKRGYWKKYTEKALIDQALPLLQQKFQTTILDVKKIKSVVEELKSLLITDPEIGHPQFGGDITKDNPFSKTTHDSDYIAIRNGVVDVRTGEITPWNSQKHYYTMGFEVNWTEETERKCQPFLERWKSHITEWLSDADAEKFLQEYIGYALTPSCSRRCMVMLLGKGRNGKSMFLDIIINMFKNASNEFKLSRFESDFYGADIKDRRLLYDADMDLEYIKHSGKLKSLVAGDPVKYNEKYEKTYNFIPTAKLLMCTNSLPKTSDSSFGFGDRMHIINFPNTFETNVDFVKSLADFKKPLGRLAIFIWAFEGLQRLNAQGKFTDSNGMKDLKEEYILSNDPVQTFINEQCYGVKDFVRPHVKQEESSTPHNIMYERYKEWCKETGERPRAKTKFDALMREKGFTKRTVCTIVKGNVTERKSVTSWLNLIIKDSPNYKKVVHEESKL